MRSSACSTTSSTTSLTLRRRTATGCCCRKARKLPPFWSPFHCRFRSCWRRDSKTTSWAPLHLPSRLRSCSLLKEAPREQPATNGLSDMFVAFDGSKHEQALQPALTAAEKGWLLRTNEAKLSSAAATALASNAGWAKAVGKALSSANVGCVGLELFLPADEAQTLKNQVSQLGGHASDSELAGKAFRTTGLDG
ncbi:hypothetical protein VaNZ11_005333 [Volvox africanus]|uniref:Uncharacterized protein n=1 Tax=Volvox africanus TaxID=51714 RepID=A0ABQ5RYF8_9CHLO|nr:hypothetical protein VaNZ11_005333 [Volvox africanus]